MITKTMEKNNITWINTKSPTNEEVFSMDEKFSLHPFIKNELLKPTFQPKINFYNNTVYLILHFPVFDQKTGISKRQEIDFVISQNFLFTIHYGDFPPLSDFIKKIESHPEIIDSYFKDNTGILLFNILRHLYRSSSKELDHIQKKIDKIEEKLLLKKEKEMVKQISDLSRAIIEFGRSIRPHERILSSFENLALNIFEEKYKTYSDEIINEYFNVKNLFESAEETVKFLREANDSLVSIESNEQMRIISILAFITFPLMLLTSIFGMNTAYLPFIGVKGDFWIIIGFMIIGMTTMFLIFKKKRWI